MKTRPERVQQHIHRKRDPTDPYCRGDRLRLTSGIVKVIEYAKVALFRLTPAPMAAAKGQGCTHTAAADWQLRDEVAPAAAAQCYIFSMRIQWV